VTAEAAAPAPCLTLVAAGKLAGGLGAGLATGACLARMAAINGGWGIVGATGALALAGVGRNVISARVAGRGMASARVAGRGMASARVAGMGVCVTGGTARVTDATAAGRAALAWAGTAETAAGAAGAREIAAMMRR
jgi:hypothetical protein